MEELVKLLKANFSTTPYLYANRSSTGHIFIVGKYFLDTSSDCYFIESMEDFGWISLEDFIADLPPPERSFVIYNLDLFKRHLAYG